MSKASPSSAIRHCARDVRGSYRGLAEPGVIKHLRRLGVTAIELLPMHFFLDDRYLLDRGLRNYWGYNTLSFFTPDAALRQRRCHQRFPRRRRGAARCRHRGHPRRGL